MDTLTSIGWRERVALPAFGISAIKAKIDTGARSSALHVEALSVFEQDGRRWVEFGVRVSRKSVAVRTCRAPVVDERVVTDSSGNRQSRLFIRVPVVAGNCAWEIEVSLASRGAMLFPMLLGRTSIEGRFAVDPRLSYALGRPQRALPDAVRMVSY